jgi:RNA polymerase sigma-70 factor (ECF subfamily)
MGLEADTVVAFLLRHRLRLVAAAAGIVRNPHDSDDVFQQVVLAALEARDQLKDSEHLLAWGVRAIRHRAIDVARRKHLGCLSDRALDLLEAEYADPSGPVPTDQAEALWACLEKLTPAARTLMKLRYFDGLPVPLIADRMGRTTDAVYQLLSRTHRALRSCVEVETNGAGGEVESVLRAKAEGGAP